MTRAAGLLLTVPFGLTAVLIVIVGIVERRNMFRPNSEAIAEHVLATRLGHVSGMVGIISMLAGFALFTGLLRDAGNQIASSIGVVLFGVTTILFIVDLTVRTSVGVWSAQQSVATGEEPGSWEVVLGWVNANANVFVTTGFVATGVYGLAILQTGLLADGLGWLAIGWSAFWLLLSVVMRGGIPGILPIMPFVIGVALLLQPV
jgi:hypothetical protein